VRTETISVSFGPPIQKTAVTMFVFHWKLCVAGRELVGAKTCGSTFSNSCSRSFMAYFAKSAALEYGEVSLSTLLCPRQSRADIAS
jgi:hypothetical protein